MGVPLKPMAKNRGRSRDGLQMEKLAAILSDFDRAFQHAHLPRCFAGFFSSVAEGGASSRR